jgi:HAD superfamily hydrolase (TIGR01509 family)
VIRGIIFDCFGVLYHGSLDHLRDMAPAGRVQEVTDLGHSFDYGYITSADYFAGVGAVLGRTPKEIEQICREQHVRNEPLVAYIRTLRPAYKIALLSNVGRGFVEGLFSANELTELFDTEVLSNEVGMAKPSAGIFELTAERLELRPEECVMIDDIPRNVEGAVAVGMKGVVYDSMDQMKAELAVLLGQNNA